MTEKIIIGTVIGMVTGFVLTSEVQILMSLSKILAILETLQK